jgi:hypothetical protein
MLHDAADARATDASLINASPGAPARSRSWAAVACMDRRVLPPYGRLLLATRVTTPHQLCASHLRATVCPRTQEHAPPARKVCRRHAVAARSVALPCPVGQADGSLLQA